MVFKALEHHLQEVMKKYDITAPVLKTWRKAGLKRYKPPIAGNRSHYYRKSEIEKFRKVKNILIWEKNNHGSGDLFGDYAPKYEMVLFCSNGDKKLNGGRDSNIIKANRTQNNLHPTEKPVNLMEYFIEKSSEKNDLVLDTFAGSGSTLVACKNTKRNFIGFEIEETCINTINKRLQSVQGSLF